jgi:hypothetical protein
MVVHIVCCAASTGFSLAQISSIWNEFGIMGFVLKQRTIEKYKVSEAEQRE